MNDDKTKDETNALDELDYEYDITISEDKYNELKLIESYYKIWKNSDFILSIKQGEVIPSNNPNYYKNRIYLEIIDLEDYNVEVEGKEYSLTNEKLTKIKSYINEQITQLIRYGSIASKKFEINTKQKITIKIGNVTIRIDGNTNREVKDYCTTFITSIINIIKEQEDIEFLG